MKRISEEILQFFHDQNFVIVSTIGGDGSPHNACKGVVKIAKSGQVYLLDLYRADTLRNLKQNPMISITSVDEHRFRGYCLKGKAKVVEVNSLGADILKSWEERITSRITQRVLRNIRGEKGHSRHPEIQLPGPKYMISMEVEQIIDLTPHKLR